jgi:heptosyltransferase-2
MGRPEIIPEENSEVKILFICLAFRGDLILNFPAILALKRKFPRSKITCWVREYNRNLAALNRDIDDVICYDDFEKTGIRMLIDLARVGKHDRIIAKLSKGKFDVCIDDSGSAFTTVTCFLAGIPFRVGRNSQGFGFLFHYEYPYDFNESLTRKKLTLLEPLGIFVKDIESFIQTIQVSEDQLRMAMERCGLEFGRSNYFTVQPFGGWEAKSWGIENFAYVVDNFASKTGLIPVFIGGRSDFAGISGIEGIIRMHGCNAAGKLALDESAALIAGAQLHFGVDSFGTHVAEATGVKSLTIFGPTNPRLIAILQAQNIAVMKKTSCSPPEGKIYCCPDAGRSCRSISCMRELEAEDVLSVLIDLWEDKVKERVIEF